MTTIDILKAARDKISDPVRWTKGFLARTKDGLATGPRNKNAVCWCANGALFSVAKRADAAKALFFLRGFIPGGYCNVSVFNDNSTRAEVLALFDRAIAEEQEIL